MRRCYYADPIVVSVFGALVIVPSEVEQSPITEIVSVRVTATVSTSLY